MEPLVKYQQHNLRWIVMVFMVSKMKVEVIKALKDGRLENVNEVQWLKAPSSMKSERNEGRSSGKKERRKPSKIHSSIILKFPLFISKSISVGSSNQSIP